MNTTPQDGDFVILEGEPNQLYRVIEERGDRSLVVAIGTGMAISPTTCVSNEFIRVWNGSGTDEMIAAHMAIIVAECEAEGGIDAETEPCAS